MARKHPKPEEIVAKLRRRLHSPLDDRTPDQAGH